MLSPYLSNFITTLSNRRRVRVGDLLDSVRVAKDQIQVLADQLFGASDFSPLILTGEDPNTIMTSSRVAMNFRDTSVRINDIFSMSNTIALILDSHSAVLSSDIKAVEDELIALEKMAANYAFLLGDGKAYDFAHLEPFNDALGREQSFNFLIPDRAGMVFGPAETAAILTSQGVLVLPEMGSSHGLVGSIINGNARQYLREATDFSNIYTQSSAAGWVASVRAPHRVSASLPEANGRSGAQLMLEFSLSQPAPANVIRLSPMSDFDIQVLKVTLYPTSTDEGAVELLGDTEVRELYRPMSLYFPMQPVARFRVLINQPIYDRRSSQANLGEEEARAFLEAAKARASDRPITKETTRSLQDRFRRLRLTTLARKAKIDGGTEELVDRQFRTSTPSTTSSWGAFDGEYMRKVLNRERGMPGEWSPQDQIAEAFYRIAIDRISDLRKYTQRDWEENSPNNSDINSEAAIEAPVRRTPPIFNEYIYKMGLSNVSIGVDTPGFKGVFVSKPMQSEGDIGMVRLKTAQTNTKVTNVVRSSPWATSVEYSVTNQSNPKLESHWIPILPTSQTEVIAERFFPDSAGRGYLRFPADTASSLILYKNGNAVAVSPQSYIRGAGLTNIAGISLPLGEYSPDDIFTVDYVPAGDPTTVSFEGSGFVSDAPLIATFDSTGTGEGYVTTVGRNEIDLLHTPYIDSKQLANSLYNPVYGHPNFQPIIVKLSTGAIATNLTNYLGGTQTTLPEASQGYYYIHAGRTLAFNQKVENFRVFYQYMENAVRYRIVLRVNDKTSSSPSVDYVHLKGKTRRANPLTGFQ